MNAVIQATECRQDLIQDKEQLERPWLSVCSSMAVQSSPSTLTPAVHTAVEAGDGSQTGSMQVHSWEGPPQAGTLLWGST